MKNVFGNAITVTLFGESHGPSIGCVVDGLAPGIKIDEDYVALKLSQRRAAGAISTARHEADLPIFESGVYNGYTTGTPLCIRIANKDTKSGDYDKTLSLMRPGHSDYPAECKYHGYQDKHGGGHFSGRITAPLVAVGAILASALKNKGIYIGTHIKSLGAIEDGAIAADAIEYLDRADFPVINENIKDDMTKCIIDAKNHGDSVGGILETLVTGMPAGVGEPWFDSVESMISHAMFSIPAIKGIEFGDGFDLTKMNGSQANDAYRIEDGKVYTLTNHMGGIGGGITNGQDVIFRCAVKPTPSIALKQQTIDVTNMKNAELEIKGRHDSAIIHRAKPVVDAMTAITIADLLTVRYGTDYLGEN